MKGGKGVMNRPKFVIALLAILVAFPAFIHAELTSVEYERDVYYNSDPQSGAPLDVDYHTPGMSTGSLLEQDRLHICLQAGTTPYYLKGGIRVKFIWDTDSVGPGNTFSVKVVAETDSAFKGNPYFGGSHEIYSNYGVQVGVSDESRVLEFPYGIPTWGDWTETLVGIGFDLCINMRGDGILPMESESLTAGDLVTLMSIGADMLAGGKAVKDRHGNPIKDDAASSVLGLINLVSLGISNYYKLQNGHIYLEIEPVWPFYYDPAYGNNSQHVWIHRGDTVVLHLAVDPLATNNDTGYFRILSNGYVEEDIYYRQADHIDFLWWHDDFYTQPWLPLRNGTVALMLDDNFPLIPVPLTGESHSHADLYIDPGYLSVWNTRYLGGYVSFTPTPQVEGWTGVGIKVKNKGNITSTGYTIKFVFPDSVKTEHRDGNILPGGHDDVDKMSPQWTQTGVAPIYVIIIPDSTNHDPNPHNDTLNFNVFVRKHTIPVLVAIVDEATGDTITPSDSVFDRVWATNNQNYFERGVPDTTYNHWDRWLLMVPEGEAVTITAFPDSNHPNLYASSKYVNVDASSSEPLWVYIRLWGWGSVEGTITDESGTPIESTLVSVGPFYTSYTDQNGHYLIEHLPSNHLLTNSPYYVRFYAPGYRIDSVPFHIRNFETANINHQMVNIDTIPPIGEISCPSVVAKTLTISLTAMDTFTQFGDTLPPTSVMIKDNNSTWHEYDYGMGFDKSITWTLHTRTSHNEVDTLFAKFEDNAGNISDSIMQVVTVAQDPPVGTFTINHGNSSTSNPDVMITDVTITSSTTGVRDITIEEAGGATVTYSYSEGTEYPFSITTTAGTHTIWVTFTDSLGLTSQPVSNTIELEYSGRVSINNGAQFTSSTSVDLSIEASSFLVSNVSGDDMFGGHPMAQSFVPHADRIYGISVYIMGADSGLKIGIYSDSVAGNTHLPGRMLVLDTLNYDPQAGWVTISYTSPISVDPDSSYMIVLFQTTLDGVSNNLYVKTGPSNNYSEGDLYFYPTYRKRPTDDWYFSGYDMVFRVLGRADSMEISNYEDFHNSTGMISFSSYYSGWELLPGDGLKRVYVRIMTGSNVSTVHDAIILDREPPTDISVSILNHLPYLETTECTLSIYAVDALSDVAAYNINDGEWQDAYRLLPMITVHNVPSGMPGPRTMSFRFKDRAGNISDPTYLTIDYDPDGPYASVRLGNDGFSPSETVGVHISLAKFKGKSITVDSMRFSPVRRFEWGDWMPFKSDTSYIFDKAGNVGLWVELKDNYGKTSSFISNCVIDTTPPDEVYNVRDEGDSTTNHSSLAFWWQCRGDYESGLSQFQIVLSTDPSCIGNIVTVVYVPPEDRYARIYVPGLHGDSTYYAKIVAVNRAGLWNESDPTDGIKVINGIAQFDLISPSDSALVENSQPVQLVWHGTSDSLSSLTGYEVFIDRVSYRLIEDTTLSIDTLEDGWHSWYVVAHDSLGDTKISSSTYSFYLGAAPQTPLAIFPSDTFLNSDTVNFIWSSATKSILKETSVIGKIKEKNSDGITEGANIFTIQIAADTSFSSIVDSSTTSDTTLSLAIEEGRWFWRVQASNPLGTSDWSLTTQFGVDTTAPTTFAGISPSESDTIHSDTVQFLWHSSMDNFGLIGYRLTCFSQDTAITVFTGDTSSTITLRSGDYQWYVEAIDSAGNIALSDTTNFTVEVITLPTPMLISPQNDTVIAHTNGIEFVWRTSGIKGDLADIDGGKTQSYGFVFQLSLDSLFQNTVVCDTIADTVITLDISEGHFYWRVRAADSTGHLSYWTATWNLLVDATPPNAPVLISPSDNDTLHSDTIQFLWHAAADNFGIMSYQISCWSTDTSLDFQTHDTSLTIILRNGNYTWAVNAIDSAGHSTNSDSFSFMLRVFNLPTPVLIWPHDDSIYNTFEVPFVWSPGDGKNASSDMGKPSDHYIIEVSSDSSFDNINISDTLTTDTSETLSLWYGYAYWKVRRYDDEGGLSAWTTTWTTGVDTSRPWPPYLISPPTRDTIDTNVVTFVWLRSLEQFSGVAYYWFRYEWCWQPWDSLKYYDIMVYDTTLTLDSLPPGNYAWFLDVVDSAGNSNYFPSDMRSFYIDYIAPPYFMEPTWDEWQHGSVNFRWRFPFRDTTISIPYLFQLQVMDSTDSIVMDVLFRTYQHAQSFPSGIYHCRVRVNSAGDSSAWSEIDSFRIDDIRPSVPQLLAPESGGHITSCPVQFSWSSSRDNLSGVMGYQLLISLDPELGSPVIDTFLSDTTFLLDTLADGRWYWQVRVSDSANNIAGSEVDSFYMDIAPLPIPITTAPSYAQWQQGDVTLTWEIPSSYTKTLKGKGNPYSFIVELLKGGVPVFCDTVAQESLDVTLKSGYYHWHVRTYLNYRSSDWSPIDSFRVDDEDPPYPVLKKPVYGEYINSLPYEFLWSSLPDTLSGLVGYRLLISDNESMTNPAIDTMVQTSNYMLNNLDNGEWYWQVIARDSAGNESPSEIDPFIIDTIPPEPVELISPEDGMILSDPMDIEFYWHWVELSKISGFKGKGGVSFELNIADSSDTLVIPELIDTNYVYDELDEGWYSWWVRAYDEAGNWSSSGEWSFAIDTTSPLIESTHVWHDTSFTGPFDVSAWVYDLNGLSAIRLFYAFGQSPREFDSLDMVPGAHHNFYHAQIPEVQDSTMVNYFIYAADNAWEPNESYDPEDTIYHFRVTPENIEEDQSLPTEFDLKVIPLPFTDRVKLIFASPSATTIKLSIYGSSGRIVYQKTARAMPGFNAYELRLNLHNGVYFAKVRAGSEEIIRKFVILR